MFDLELAAHCYDGLLKMPTFGLQEVKVRPDAAVWNALIAAAGRAGQLQRAFEALQDMQVRCLVIRFLLMPDLLTGLFRQSLVCVQLVQLCLLPCTQLWWNPC